MSSEETSKTEREHGIRAKVYVGDEVITLPRDQDWKTLERGLSRGEGWESPPETGYLVEQLREHSSASFSIYEKIKDALEHTSLHIYLAPAAPYFSSEDVRRATEKVAAGYEIAAGQLQAVLKQRLTAPSGFKRIRCDLPAEDVAALDEVAARTGRTRTELVRAAVRRFIDEASDEADIDRRYVEGYQKIPQERIWGDTLAKRMLGREPW